MESPGVPPGKGCPGWRPKGVSVCPMWGSWGVESQGSHGWESWMGVPAGPIPCSNWLSFTQIIWMASRRDTSKGSGGSQMSMSDNAPPPPKSSNVKTRVPTHPTHSPCNSPGSHRSHIPIPDFHMPLNTPKKHQTLYTLKPIYPQDSPNMPLYHTPNPYILYSHGSPSKSSESRPLCPEPPIRLIPAHSCPSASPVNARHP